MRRFLVLTLAVALLTVMAVGTAAAQGPDVEGSESWFTETIDDIGFCAFPVALHSTVHEVITPSGVQHWHGFESYTNPANGKSFASTWSESWKFGNKGIQGNGVLWKLTVPGYGVVLLEAGFVLYGGPPDYEFIRGAGPSIDGAAIEAFCDLMA
jgi:hypothetical protein